MAWLAWAALFIAACWTTDWLWQKLKTRRATSRAAKRRAIDMEWLRELSEAYVNGTGGDNNLRRQLAHIEADYETYAAEFPDLEERLVEAQTALKLSPMAEQLAQMKVALGDKAARLGSPPDKGRLR